MAKKKMIKESTTVCTCPHCHMGKGAYVFKGIIAIMLGLILWFGYLTLGQVIAIVLILTGIKKLFYSSKYC